MSEQHSISAARNNWSRLVALARAGETVILTHRGRAVAKITGLEPPSPPNPRLAKGE